SLVNLTIHEQGTVDSPALPVDGKEHQAGCFPIDAVQRRQILDAGAASQAVQKAFVNVSPAGCHREKVRLAGNQDFVIDKQDFFSKRNVRLTADFAEIIDAFQRDIFTV